MAVLMTALDFGCAFSGIQLLDQINVRDAWQGRGNFVGTISYFGEPSGMVRLKPPSNCAKPFLKTNNISGD